MDEKLLMKDFCLLSGLSEEEANEWQPLVSVCWEELRARLRSGVDVQKHSERLAFAAAALANQRFMTIQAEGCASVKVGDISFTRSDSSQARNQLLEMVGDLLDSSGVAIKGVSICPVTR